MIKRYRKLVRDRIPEIIERSGGRCVTEVLEQEEYLAALREKLGEELAEYRRDGSPEELADLLEVLLATALAQGVDRNELEQIRLKKAEARGGFDKRLMLLEVENDQEGTASAEKHRLYRSLCSTLESLLQGVPHAVANHANAAALLYHGLEDLNWAGFYWLEEERLVLGAFQGKPACIEIPVGRGVCGTAVARSETVLVEDVHRFKGHIACDSASNSEIVIPIRRDGRVVGVLDLDSPTVGRFTEDDQKGLENFVAVLERCLF